MENKDMTPKVSIIMGIYNCARTLPEAINSIIAQSYDNWELIMCDDGSSDDTYMVAEKYRKKAPDKIILLKNNQNIRLAKTLNHCLKYASGPLIARMDGDDLSEPDRLKKQVVFLMSHPEFDLVGTQMISFDELGDRGVRKVKAIPQKEDLARGTPFCHATIMTWKYVYDRLGGYSEAEYISRCEDVELWYRFFHEGFNGYNLQEPLYKVRETIDDFKRRKLTYTFDTMRVCFNGFRLLNYPIYKYIYVLKPLASDLTPRRIMKIYHNIKDALH